MRRSGESFCQIQSGIVPIKVLEVTVSIKKSEIFPFRLLLLFFQALHNSQMFL